MNIESNKTEYKKDSGIALIMTIVVLVILSAIVYRVSISVSRYKHRQQYMLDYQQARYIAESAMKYALATISNVDPNLISRPNEPDFSDVFAMNQQQYQEFVDYWRPILAAAEANDVNSQFSDDAESTIDFSFLFDTNDANQADVLASYFSGDSNDLDASEEEDDITIRGPYGPRWPLVAEPVTLNFGNATAVIEIADENAKFPLEWGFSVDEDVKDESEAAVETFCEWMQFEPNQIEALEYDLEVIKDIKPYSKDLKPVVSVSTKQVSTAENTKKPERRTSRRSRRSTRRTRTKTVSTTRPQIGHNRDFVKLINSPLLDYSILTMRINDTPGGNETALKYVSLWTPVKVNVNSATRQVLEAAFMYGGDAVEIADTIITERRQKPFESIDDLKDRLLQYKVSIDKCADYITTTSDTFAVRIKATSGIATATAVAGVKKNSEKYETIGIILQSD